MTAPTGPKGEAPATTPVHPLDPLTAAEFRQVVGVLRRDRGVTGRWRFASIELQEPTKDALHAWSAGDPLRRTARAVCWDRDDGRVFAALVSLSEDRVLSFEHQPGQQPAQPRVHPVRPPGEPAQPLPHRRIRHPQLRRDLVPRPSPRRRQWRLRPPRPSFRRRSHR